MQAQKGIRAAHVGGRVKVSAACVKGVRRTRIAHVGGKGRIRTAHMGGKGATGTDSKRGREAAVEAAGRTAKGQRKITCIGEGRRVGRQVRWQVAVAYPAQHR